MSIPPSVSMLLFCYLVLQQGSSSPQAPYKRSLSFKHTQGLAYFLLSPGRLTTCQRHASGEQDLCRSPLLSWPTPLPAHMHWGFCGCSAPAQTLLKPSSPGNHLKQSSFLGSVWLGKHLPPQHTHHHHSLLYFFTKLQEALTFYSQAIRSYLECVTRAILHHLTDQEPPCKADPGMSRYRFGEKREWGM